MKGTLLLTWALFVVLAMGGVSYVAHSAARRAVAEQEARRLSGVVTALRAQVDSLQRMAARVDTVYRTVRVRYDSLLPGDTVRVRDTLYVRKDIADTTIRACGLALDACQRAGLARDVVIAAQDSLITALRRRPGPCRLLGVPCGVAALLGGFAAGVVVAK